MQYVNCFENPVQIWSRQIQGRYQLRTWEKVDTCSLTTRSVLILFKWFFTVLSLSSHKFQKKWILNVVRFHIYLSQQSRIPPLTNPVAAWTFDHIFMNFNKPTRLWAKWVVQTKEGSEQSSGLLTRPSRPIRCDVWIVERMRYRQTDRPTDGHSQL